MARPRYELRCFCAREPLLAVYGLDERGRLYVHVRVIRQKRITTETITYGGEIMIRCRECQRWQRVVFHQPDRVTLKEDFVAEELITDEP